SQISDVLRDAAARGEVRDINPDFASRGFFGMIISHRWQRIKSGPDAYSEEMLAQSLADLLLHGILQAGAKSATPASAADQPGTPA
ncbi:MAG: hypothetical protein M3Z20_00415, partial [Chloroflexota bacterium]|nr:hypothetical protein [Chloroflexota bacterium]